MHAGIVRPHPLPSVPFGLGVVGVRGGACINCQSCLSFTVETEHVTARCGTSSVWLRFKRAELRFDRRPFKDLSATEQPNANNDVWRGRKFQGCEDRFKKGDGCGFDTAKGKNVNDHRAGCKKIGPSMCPKNGNFLVLGIFRSGLL